MIVYVGAGSGPFRDFVIAAGHGQMVSRPSDAFRVPKTGRWAFDNGAFTDWKHGTIFDNDEYLRRIQRILELPPDRRPDWCVCPDMVGKAVSLAYSIEWRALLREQAPSLKFYLALQDSMHPDDVARAICLEPFDGIFIGGSTRWKHDTSAAWVKWGHARGLPVHIGRVNGPAGIQWAVDIEADSIDGTGWVRAGWAWAHLLEHVPTPSIPLFNYAHEENFPAEWLSFGGWLENIYSEKDWRSFSENEADDPSHYERIHELGPEEFLRWFNASYRWGISLPSTGFSDERDFQEWKMGLVHQAERLLGKRHTAPEAELPQFVLDICRGVLPLSKVLEKEKGVIIERCQSTGMEMAVVRDRAGVILQMRPVVRAENLEDARKMAEKINPIEFKRVFCRRVTSSSPVKRRQ